MNQVWTPLQGASASATSDGRLARPRRPWLRDCRSNAGIKLAARTAPVVSFSRRQAVWPRRRQG